MKSFAIAAAVVGATAALSMAAPAAAKTVTLTGITALTSYTYTGPVGHTSTVTFDFNIPAGKTYRFSYDYPYGSAFDAGFSYETITSTTAPLGVKGVSGAVVEYEVTAVPEAGTWALMIVGVGMAGGALRRKAMSAANFA